MNLHPVHHGLRRKMLAVLVAACYTSASANPGAPQVIAGQATFQQNGKLFSITNTPNAIINWQSFSIAQDEITRFIQQNADSRVLNRITGQDPSKILGALQSNGKVYLINPNGVVFGKDARIDVQGLVASSLAISDSDFLAGKNRFAGAGAGAVSNAGAITTPGGGQVYLIGSSVENSGVITSPQGEVVLAAGHTVQLVDSSDPAVHVVLSAPADQALNLGQVLAGGGRVGIYGALVNQRGKVSADSAVRGENGRIVLKASGATTLEKNSSTTAVNSAGQGGDIQLLGERVGLTDDALVDASGAQGGGQVLVGGGYQGKDTSVPNARQTYIGERAVVRADALDHGNGGRIIAWSDNATYMYGSLSARGGARGGDGGFIETSGHYLDMRGSANTSAPFGKTGQLLLDPTAIEITNEAYGNIQPNNNTYAESGSSTSSGLAVGVLQNALASNDITVTTTSSASGTGTLTVSTAIEWSSSNSLSLIADSTLSINAAIINRNAALSLTSNSGSISQTSSGTITAASLIASAPSGSITLNNSGNTISGNVSATAASNILLAAQTLSTGTVTATGSGAVIQAVSTSGPLNVNGNITSNGGAITLQAPFLNGIVTGSSTAISSGGGAIVLQADNMDLQGAISAGAGGISAVARSTSQALHLGGTEADSTNILALSEAEIQRMSTTGALTFTTSGSTGAPTAVVNALNVTSTHPSGALNILTAGDASINVQGAVSTVGDLVIGTTDTTSARITVDGALTSSSGTLVLSTGKVTLNQNLAGTTVAIISHNSMDLGATSDSSGVMAIPSSVMSKFVTNQLSFTVNTDNTAGDITISQPLTWGAHLYLTAEHQFLANASVNVTGQLFLTNGDWIQNAASLPSLTLGRLALSNASFLRVLGGDGSSASPYQITDVYGLQGVGTLNNTDNYILANDIAASSTSNWNNGLGFAPLGSSSSPYNGTFDGNSKTITGLSITRTASSDPVGLFSYVTSGTIKNLTLSGGTIIGNDKAGAVVGFVNGSSASVQNVTSSAPVTSNHYAGGLVGGNMGTITGSSASGTVTSNAISGSAEAGGLVGINTGAITKSFATGAVSSTGEMVGGLVGENSSGSISKSFATGSVTGGRNVGGLAGRNTGSVANTFATGSVSGATSSGLVTHEYVGGLMGDSNGSVATSYSTGAISASGFTNVHGSIGGNFGAYTNVYWNSDTAGSGMTDSAGTSLTSAQMKQQASLSGFDFTSTWQLYNGNTNAMLKDFLVPLTVTLTGGTTSKTYDGNAQAFDATAAYSGFTGGDTSASLSGTLGWGSSGATHAGSYAPSGLYSSKYDIGYTGATSALTIAQRPVTVTVTGSKVYDGALSLSSPNFSIPNVITADTANVSLSGTAAFQTKTVGINKPLTLNISLSGSAAGDYTISSSSGTGTITAAPLTVSGLTGVNRVYDATTAATLNTGSATLCCKAGDDAVTVSYTPGLTTFADKNVGNAKIIMIPSSAFALGGADSGNYTLTLPTITADITAAPLTVSGLSGVSRVYDATTTATVTGTPSISGKIGSDVVSIASIGTGTFADKNVGAGKAITLPGSAFTLTGTDAGNYSVTAPGGLTANITAATLTASGVSAVSRTYDTTTTAILTGTPLLSGVINTDVVSASTTLGNGSFASKTVGAGKAVTAPGSVITLQGADAGNYTVSALTGLTADIAQAPLTVSGLTAGNRSYNATTSATTSGGSLVGVLGNDVVTLGAVTAAFSDKNVGTGKSVTVSNVATSGADAGNYSVTLPSGLTANITPATLTVSGMTGVSRVYDGTATATTSGGTLSGILGSEDVSVGAVSASFADKNVGAGKTVTVSSVGLGGADAANYTATPPTGLTANITAASLTVSGITGVSRVYDGTTTAGLGGTPALSGVFSGDTVSLNSSLGTGAFATKAVGTAKAITIPTGALTITGADAANYTLTIPTGITADVTAAALTVTGLSAVDRTYNGATSVATTGGSLSGVIGSDSVSLGAVTADFTNKNVGVEKTVTVSNVALSGADAGNYTVTPPTGLFAAVSAAPLTVTGLAGVTRVYDGTATATASGGALSGVFGSDSVSIGSITASFANKNVGASKPVTVSAVSLSGTDAGNYTVGIPTGLTAAITPATLTLPGIAGVNKVYDGTTTASTAGGALTGVIGSDVVTAGSFTASYADKNVGTAKPLTLSTIALSGADAGNYVLTQPGGLTADITQRPLSTWVGGVDNLWTTAGNWQNSVAPDGANVAAASLPLSTGTVVLPSGSVTLTALTATGGQALTIAGGTLTLGTGSGDVSNTGAISMSSGALNVIGSLSGASYAQTGGALGGSGNVTFNNVSLGGGAISGLNALAATNSWSHSAGTVSIPGSLSITQNTGSLSLGATTAQTGITLNVTEGGAVTQTGPIVTHMLQTTSQNGVTLTNSGNQILAYSGTNSGSGGISLVNTSGTNTLTLGAITSTNGGVTIDNTGGIAATGAISAPTGTVSLTAHSPITVTGSISADSIALDASTAITLSSTSSLSAVHNITMDGGAGVNLDGALSSTSGSISITADTGNVVAGASATINSPGGVTITSTTGSVTAPSTIFQGGTTPVISDAVAIAAAQQAAADAAAKAAADAAAKAAADAEAKAAADAAAKAAADAAAKAAADAAAKAAADAAAKAAADAAAKAAADAAAKAAADAAAKAAADAAAKAAADAAAKAAADAAAKAAADAAAKAAEEAAAKAAADAAAKAAADAAAQKAAEEAAAKAAADAAAQKAAEEAAAKAAADAAAKAAADAAAKAAADAAAKAAADAAAKAAADAAAKAAADAAAKAAADAAAKKAADDAAAKAAAEAKSAQTQQNAPVRDAINSTVNIINTSATKVADTAPAATTTTAATAATGGGSSSSSTASTASDSKPSDSDAKKEEKKDGVAAQDTVPKKDDTVKKLYCN